MELTERLREQQGRVNRIDLYRTGDRQILLEIIDDMILTCADLKLYCTDASQEQVLNYCLIKTEYAKQLTLAMNSEDGKELVGTTLNYLIKECALWGKPEVSDF